MSRAVEVDSSNLEAVCHSVKASMLYVKFKKERHYLYKGVDAAVYQQLLAAPSKGVFLNSKIKGVYQFQEISGFDEFLAITGEMDAQPISLSSFFEEEGICIL